MQPGGAAGVLQRAPPGGAPGVQGDSSPGGAPGVQECAASGSRPKVHQHPAPGQPNQTKKYLKNVMFAAYNIENFVRKYSVFMLRAMHKKENALIASWRRCAVVNYNCTKNVAVS